MIASWRDRVQKYLRESSPKDESLEKCTSMPTQSHYARQI
jgi:hypothetical protein